MLHTIITGRNEVVAKVMFLHVCVILFTGEGGLQAGTPPGRGENPSPRTRQTSPPGRREEPPPDQADHPPPRTRQTPPGPGTPPRTRQTPPAGRTPPPGKQTPEYGLRAAGTHPTGMHSCFHFNTSRP